MRTYSNPSVEHYADRFRLLDIARTGYNLLQYFANPRRCEAKARYQRLRLDRHGMSFDQFLNDPERGEALALRDEPPLPSQQAAILRIWAQQDTGLALQPKPSTSVAPHWSDGQIQDWRELLAGWRDAEAAVERDIAHLPQRNGAYVEPLHHHRYHACNAAVARFQPSKRGA